MSTIELTMRDTLSPNHTLVGPTECHISQLENLDEDFNENPTIVKFYSLVTGFGSMLLDVAPRFQMDRHTP